MAAKEFEILNELDFDNFVDKVRNAFKMQKELGKKFKLFKISTKAYRKSKTPESHKYYFVCIGHVKQAFRDIHQNFNEDQIHDFMKKESGFTKIATLPNGKNIMMTCSIADLSKDVNAQEIFILTEFVINWTKENLGYDIPKSDKFKEYKKRSGKL